MFELELEGPRRSIPRFFSFMDWAYLIDAIEMYDKQHEKQILEQHESEHPALKTARQSLYRAVFISVCSTLEQNLDEICRTAKLNKNIELSPSDLKHRGIKRSIVYAQKVLGRTIDINSPDWKDALALQELRNYLVHNGPEISNHGDTKKIYDQLHKKNYVSLEPLLCFSVEEIQNIINLFIRCIKEF